MKRIEKKNGEPEKEWVDSGESCKKRKRK